MRNGILGWIVTIAASASAGCGYSTGDFTQGDSGPDAASAEDSAAGGDSSTTGDSSSVVDSRAAADSKASIDSASGLDTGVDTMPPPTCSGSQTACDGVCVDTQKDVNNCGSCGHRCDVPGGEKCRGGGCM